jgi:hypothetical protein
VKAQPPHNSQDALQARRSLTTNYLLVNRSEITQNALIMKRHSLVIGIIVAVVTCSDLLAQEKPPSNQTPPSSAFFRAVPLRVSNCT